MNKKIIAAAMALAVVSGAVSAFPAVNFEDYSITASAASLADYAGNYSVPITLINASTGGPSMGNPALEQTGDIVIDEKGSAYIKLHFHPLTIGSNEGYLGFFRRITDSGIEPATVLEQYVGVYDGYNNSTSSYCDSNVVGMWYPKVVSIPVDVTVSGGKITGKNGRDINVQVYVSVMEQILSGGGTQPAILRIDWDNISKKDTNLTGSSASITGDISLKNYIELSDTVTSDPSAKVVSTVNGFTAETAVSDAEKTDNGYVFPVNVPAKDMTSDITVEVQLGDGTVVDTYTTSVEEYAMNIIYGDYTDQQKKLAKAMLNYGGYAQVYFGNTKNLANKNLSDDEKSLSSVTADTFNAFVYTTSGSASGAGVKYRGSSLALVSETAIKHYFQIAKSADISAYTFTVNGKTVEPIFDSGKGYYYVPVTGISAKNLAAKYTVTASNGSGTYTLNYSVMDYCKLAQDATASTDALKDVTKALYLFYQAAK